MRGHAEAHSVQYVELPGFGSILPPAGRNLKGY